MGVELIGTNPASPAGRYMDINWGYWYVLWDYFEEVAPHLTKKIHEYQLPHDGDGGLDEDDARALAAALMKSIKSGHAQKVAEASRKQYEALPDEPCDCENGKVRTPTGVETCRSCRGKGTVKPEGTHYYLMVDIVRKYAEFLLNCGGFFVL